MKPFFLTLGWLMLIILLCPLSGMAQSGNTHIDSLERILKGKLSNSERFDVLEKLFDHYKATDYQKALGYANQSYSTALAMGDSNKIVLGGRHQAYVLMDLGKNKEAVKILKKILAIAERNKEKSPELKKQIKFILNNAGIAYDHLGNYDRALEYHFKSLSIREEEGDKKSIGTALNNLGNIFHNLRDHKKAIEYYQQALNTKENIGDIVNLDRIHINIGLCYIQLNELKKAIYFINQGLNVCGLNCSDDIKREGFSGLGAAHYKNGDTNKAEDFLLRSLSISRSQKNLLYQENNLQFLGLVESSRGNRNKKMKYLHEALAIAESADFADRLIQLYEEVSKGYVEMHDYEKSTFYLNKYIKLKDSIYNDELTKNLTRVQTEYAERENQKTIVAQKQILALNVELIARQKQQTIFIGVIALLLSVLAAVLYKNYRNKLIANRRLDEKVKERTEALRSSHQHLDKSFTLQQLTMQQVWQEGQSILSSIKGLCHVAQLDVQDAKGKEYLGKVGDSTGQLAALLAKLNVK
jgi:tetratricopeptide (TPR) repeat protein